MMLGVLLAVLVSAPPPAKVESRYLTFGRSGEWVALDVHSRKPERIILPPPYSARTLTLSTDGRYVFFTAYDEAARNDLLYRWEWRSSTAPVRIGGDQGFHADPALSPDGKWVYFAHHPRMGGPPGQHQPQANAQLYRVRIDGTEMQAMTDEVGCHLRPAFRPDGALIYVHTLCSATKKSLHLMKNGVVQPEALAAEDLNEPAFSPDGMRLVFVARDGPHAILKEWTSLKRPARVMHRLLLAEDSSVRAQYGVHAREIFFQDEQSVMVLVGGRITRLFALGDVP